MPPYPDVAFMFLGGLPVPKTDAGRAWKNWIMHANKHSPALFKQILFVTHPITRDDATIKDIENKTIDKTYWAKFLGSRILFVPLIDTEDHLRTAWATRSLVDATILMMRAANQATQGQVKKFILIDKTTCPLYNLKALYNAVTANDKNWFDSPLHNKCANLLARYQSDKDAAAAAGKDGYPTLACPAHDKRACLRKTDCSFWSQWWVIDRRYVSVILDASLVKAKTPSQCGSQSIDMITVDAKHKRPRLADRVMNMALAAFGSAGGGSPCVPSDEMFFHVLMKRQFKKNAAFLATMNLIKLDQFKTSIKTIVTVPLKVIGVDPVFQLKKSIEGGVIYNAQIIQQDFSWGAKDVDITVHPKFTEPGFEKFIFSPANQTTNYYDRWREVFGHFPFYVNPIYIMDKLVTEDVVPLCSTYTDWRYINPNPFNIFRSFDHDGFYFAERNPNDPKNITSYEPNDFIEQVLLTNKLDTKQNEGYTFDNLQMGKVAYFAHPMEYNTNNLYAYVNAYNLLHYYNTLNQAQGHTTDNQLRNFESVYDNIVSMAAWTHSNSDFVIEKQFVHHNQGRELTLLEQTMQSFELLMGVSSFSGGMTFSFYQVSEKQGTRERITIPKIGVPVNAEILNGARMRGALFIRKCENGSYIHAYSQQLFADDEYLYQSVLV